jgi:hypothetical protein
MRGRISIMGFDGYCGTAHVRLEVSASKLETSRWTIGLENGSMEPLEWTCIDGENLERTFDHALIHMNLQASTSASCSNISINRLVLILAYLPFKSKSHT